MALSSIPIHWIYGKIMFEAFAWGAGTAIGELPPYFVAKAGTDLLGGRVRGLKVWCGVPCALILVDSNHFDVTDVIAALAGRSNSDLSHIEELKRKPRSRVSTWDRVQLLMFDLLQRFGFFGILIAASVGDGSLCQYGWAYRG